MQWTISAVYKSNIYMTKRDFSNCHEDTYMYSIKKGIFSEIKKDCEIVECDGEYAVSKDAFRSDISPYPVSLWKLTASGMKKIKRIVKWGAIPENGIFIRNKINYVSYPDVSNVKKAVLYQCARKGSNKRKIATVETSDVNGVFIHDVTEKDCSVYMKGAMYKYVYKSGKMKRIRSK